MAIKITSMACVAMLLFFAVAQRKETPAKYQAVEAYEVRPGILMMPKYSENGQICEMGLEKRLYSPEKIRLDAGLSREEINQAFDELVPINERGPRSRDIADNLDLIDGRGFMMNEAYQNVLLKIFSNVRKTTRTEIQLDANLVAVIQWKNRKCR